MLDVFAPFIGPLELELDAKRSPRVGKAHGLTDFGEYEARINATNYALTHDDGIDVNYADADLILVGVSRVGKTPTCLYMALHYGVKAANYPLTEEDLERLELPKRLVPYRKRLYGLTIDAQRLAQVREARRPEQQVRHDRAMPLGARPGRQAVPPRRHRRAEHDAHVDRGDREQDPRRARHRAAHVLEGQFGTAAIA